MKEIATIPLFAIPLTVYEIEHINQEKIEEVLKSVEYEPITKHKHSSVSKTLYLLNEEKELQGLKVKLESVINHYSENIIGNKPCNFKTTTSWSTRTDPGQGSDIHKHSNNIFSAVYYNKTHDNMGSIRFYDYFNKSGYDIGEKNYTIFNSTSWDVKPKDKYLVIFPAYLRHSITINESNQTRYSIACNFHPTGSYGNGDSKISNLRL